MSGELGSNEAIVESRIDPDDWDVAIADDLGPQVIVGGPGTGKSEFLVRRVLHLLDERELATDRLLVLSFGRRGVADLKDRIRHQLRGTVGHLDIATFHSYASRVLEAHMVATGPEGPLHILTGPEQTALVRELLASEDPTDWSPAFRPLLATNTFAGEVADFLLRVHDQLLDDAGLRRVAAGRDDWRGLAEFVARYRTEARRRRRIDYSQLISEAVGVLKRDPAMRGSVTHVLVDEYQDTTPSQVALLDVLTAEERNLTVAADPYQSIYSFRGAALSNVADFPARFDGHDRLPRRIVLTTSFRTPAAVLAAAERVTTGGQLPGAAGPVVPAAAQGSVEVEVFDQRTEEAEWVASEIARLHLAEGISLDALAVFVRSKRRFLPELSRALHRRRIAHDDPDARLAEQPAVRFVIDTVEAATGPDDAADTGRAIRRILLGPVFATPLGRVRDVERLRAREGVSWPDAIRRLIDGGNVIAKLLEDPSWATEQPASEGFWAIWESLPQLAAVVTNPARSDERAAWTSLAQVLDRWNERNPHASLATYVGLLEDEEFEARPLLSYRRPHDERVTLTTLHQSKGLEFEVVFICDAVDGVFPDLRPRDSLLGTRHLLSDLPRDTADYQAFRLQEERRLAYTAMGRASRRVVWTATSTGAEDGRGMPSRFLALIAPNGDLSHQSSGDAEPVTTLEAEAHLRRIVDDPSALAPTRLAALSALAKGPDYGLRHAANFAGVRPRGPDHGLVAPDAWLSPTQAERYELCPRLYALERKLRVGERRTLHADFGTIIHDVLEAVETAARDRSEPRSTVEEAKAQLDAMFPVDRFGGGVFAEAWRARGHRLLEHLYEEWPAWGTVVDLERTLELELDGSKWTGRADRIEANNGVVKVIDYKTGRTPIDKGSAAQSIQLGFYLLAAAADPEVAAHGSPREAELWYPAAKTKSLTTREFDPEALETMPDRLREIAEGISNEAWPPRPNDTCERCAVRLVCPAWPEGGEAYA